MDRGKTKRLIFGGFFVIVAIAVSVFLLMNQYMDRRTSDDVRQVAQSYVDGIATEALYHFTAIKDLRYAQAFSMKNWVNRHANLNDFRSTHDAIAQMAEVQELTTCALVAADGRFETVCGVPFIEFGDQEFLMEALREGRPAVTGGRNEHEQVVVWYVPARFLMADGRRSAGMICCRSMQVFIEKMHLDADGTFAFFHIIRRDGSFVVRSASDPASDTFFERLEETATGVDKPIEGIVTDLKDAISERDIFSFVVQNKSRWSNATERRSVLALPLPGSNWYLVSVMPFNSMDQMITDMGAARGRMMMTAVAFLFLCILAFFILYYRMAQNQIEALEESTARAENAMAEAEAASEEAMRAKQDSDEARSRAEDLLEETRAANDEATRARDEANEARLQAEASLTEAEAANDEAIRAREDAERAREEAEAANKAKSEFLSNMSHDIRTPMNAIVGMTSIARSHMEDPVRVEDCLRKISLAGKQLLGLINDVLDMAKIESGKMLMNVEALSLRETMETICDIVRPQIRSNGQKFDIFISDILSERVYCDSVRLNQVLLNFLSNAMKFTPREGFIHVYLRQEPSEKGDDYVRTHISVKDSGMGMSPEFQKKLFKAFEREDSMRVHKTQGTGLGLTITKHIVDAMGGTIEVQSAPNQGTTFHIAIDFERVRESDDEMKLPPWKILVVDDNDELCRTAELSLKELGTLPESCTDGETALKKVKEAHEKGEDYFAALIDYKMTGLNGIETTKKIREMLGDNMLISLISAYDWGELEAEAREAGVTGFIAKPLFKSTLYHELKKYKEAEAAAEPTETETAKTDAPTQETAAAPKEPEPKNPKAPLAGMKILLAEDMEVNAEIAIMMLGDCGASVERAEDGKIAVKMFADSAEGYYDAILMDLRMPNMDGYAAAKTIRAMGRKDASTVPILAMTADAFSDDAQKCFDVGMNAHIPKPIDIELLKSTLEKYKKP